LKRQSTHRYHIEMVDITILTQKEYVDPVVTSPLIQNILDERHYLISALEAQGISVNCKSWDDPHYDWSQSKALVFRSIWDYFKRFEEFRAWLEVVKEKTQLINEYSLIKWNMDKHYLADLEAKDIAIVPTVYIDSGAHRSIDEVCRDRGWKDVIIKPAVAGTAFLTYKVLKDERAKFENLFEGLVADRDMLIQPFIATIASQGEASLMVFNGKYSHAILKKAKKGEYRVQDNFGGSVHDYEPTPTEIAFAESCFAACTPQPAYGRADILWDTDGNILLGELEIIEPELWLRLQPESAQALAAGIVDSLKR